MSVVNETGQTVHSINREANEKEGELKYASLHLLRVQVFHSYLVMDNKGEACVLYHTVLHYASGRL
jgi:uncharacterized protein with HEPN domain